MKLEQKNIADQGGGGNSHEGKKPYIGSATESVVLPAVFCLGNQVQVRFL